MRAGGVDIRNVTSVTSVAPTPDSPLIRISCDHDLTLSRITLLSSTFPLLLHQHSAAYCTPCVCSPLSECPRQLSHHSQQCHYTLSSSQQRQWLLMRCKPSNPCRSARIVCHLELTRLLSHSASTCNMHSKHHRPFHIGAYAILGRLIPCLLHTFCPSCTFLSVRALFPCLSPLLCRFASLRPWWSTLP